MEGCEKKLDQPFQGLAYGGDLDGCPSSPWLVLILALFVSWTSGRQRFFFVLPEHCWQNDADSGILRQCLLWRPDPLPYDGGDGFLAGGGGHGGGGFGGPFDVVVPDGA